MKRQGAILIERPLHHVFDYLADPQNAAYWSADVKSSERLAQTPDKVGSQTRWIFESQGYEVEAIETIVAFERPVMLASQVHYIQFLRIPPPNAGQPAHTRDDYDTHFRAIYGKGQPGGLVGITFASQGDNACQVTMQVDNQIGGTSRIGGWINFLMRKNPLQDMLAGIKEAVEASPYRYDA